MDKKNIYKICDLAPPIKMEMFALNRQRLISKLEEKIPNSVVLLKGGVNVNQYNTDVVYPFRQESYFHWAFGVREPGFWGAIDVQTSKSYLFIPHLSKTDIIYMGPIDNLEKVREIYEVDEVHFTKQIAFVLAPLRREYILLLKGENSDSKLVLEAPNFTNKYIFNVDEVQLHPIMTELRVIKTHYEIELIRYANKISSEAHIFVMKRMRPNMYEYQAEALFLHYIYFIGGCRTSAYTCICSSGSNTAIIHYGHAALPNTKKIEPGDLCLFDMGASYYGYCSNITITFPINGKYTEKQKIIYNGVLKARNTVLKQIRAGIMWSDLHNVSQEALLLHLVENKILKGDICEMQKDGIGSIFQPHGLGHFLGIDIHDVGGYTETSPKLPKIPQFVGLRTARRLEIGMVLTVEPGCYFIETVLDEALKNETLNKYFCTDVLNSFRSVGGVRIEDNIVITTEGFENLSYIPHTVEEIEEILTSTRETEEKILQIPSSVRSSTVNIADKIKLIFKDELETKEQKVKKRSSKKIIKDDDPYPCQTFLRSKLKEEKLIVHKKSSSYGSETKESKEASIEISEEHSQTMSVRLASRNSIERYFDLFSDEGTEE